MSSRSIFIIHGSDGSPQENWFPWLKDELENLDHQVFVPQFPIESGHVLDKWFDKFEEYKKYVNEQSVFFAHSRGCAFVWRLLEQMQHPIFASFLVGGFSEYLWYPKENNQLDSFFTKPFYWEKIKQNCHHFTFYQSDNDPYVPVQIGEEVVEHLNISLTLIHNAGHFNTEAGYTTFPLLLEDFQRVCQ